MNTPTVIEALISGGQVTQAYFGLALGRGLDTSSSTSGTQAAILQNSQLCLGCVPAAPSGYALTGNV